MSISGSNCIAGPSRRDFLKSQIIASLGGGILGALTGENLEQPTDQSRLSQSELERYEQLFTQLEKTGILPDDQHEEYLSLRQKRLGENQDGTSKGTLIGWGVGALVGGALVVSTAKEKTRSSPTT